MKDRRSIQTFSLGVLYSPSVRSWHCSHSCKNLDKGTLIFFFFLRITLAGEFELGFGKLR